MIELHYYPSNASLFPHMLLRELGCPFELKLVDRTHGAQQSAAYLALNPHGKIPVLVDEGEAIYETAAIALHLTDRFPAAGMAPPPGAPRRAAYYRWMVHLSNTLQADYRAWFYPHEFVDDPGLKTHAKAAAGARLGESFERIAAQLGSGPWLLGEQFSAVDLYLLMLVYWGGGLPRPPLGFAELAAHTHRLLARPAVLAAFAAEGIATPFA